MDVAKLRMEAAKAGVNETGKYCEWLEHEVLHLRRHRDTLVTENNAELGRRRKAEAALREMKA